MSKPAKTEPQVRPNYIFAIVSVALVLFLLGFFGLLALQASRLMQVLKEQVSLIVEVRETASPMDQSDLKASLEASPFLLPGTLSYLPKEKGLALLEEDFGEDLDKLDLPNPLLDVFTFHVKADYLEPDSLDRIRQVLREKPAVLDVYFQEGFVEVLARNLRKITWISLALSILFTFVAFALIHNTIRLALHSNRFLIKNMELVGASWEFISRPFIRRSAWHGVLSGLLGISLLNILMWFAYGDLPDLKTLHHWPSVLMLFGGLILFGVAITTSSTYFVVHKYLKMRVDELY